MQHQSPDTDDEAGGGGTFSVERMLYAVRQRWPIIAGLTVFAFVAATAVVFSMTDRFDASSIVQIDPRTKSISNIESVISDLKAESPVVDSEVEIIQSRAVILRVIDALDLRNDPEFTEPPFFERMLQMLGLSEAPPQISNAERRLTPNPKLADADDIMGPRNIGGSAPERDVVATAFLKNLKVTRVRRTLLIDIRYSSNDAVKSAKIANTIAEVYLNEQLRSKTGAVDAATRVLKTKIDSLKDKLRVAEKRVEDFKSENDIYASEGQILSEKQLARMMEQNVIARNNTAEAAAKFEQAQQLQNRDASDTAVAEVLESHTVRLLKEQYGKATAKRAELAVKYGSRHPSMQRIAAEVADTKAQLDAEIVRLILNLKNQYEIARQQEDQLALNMQTLKIDQSSVRQANVQLQALDRDAATTKQLYETLLARYKEMGETQSLQLPDARIVEQAGAPLFPASPKRKQLVLIATAAGLALGLGIVFALEFFTFGIGRPEDVEHAFELAHLASLPQLQSSGEFMTDPLLSLRLVVAEPQSLFAESIRGVRRELDVRRAVHGANICLVAGSLPGEGSSLAASNIAHHYALAGERVLLIDGDLRMSHLSRQLAPGCHGGLVDILTSDIAPEHAILRDATTGMHFLPASSAAPGLPTTPEILGSRRMADVLGELRGQFDTIIIDAPPLLPVIDGRILADHADQILFVTTWRRTPKQLAKKALRGLDLNHRKIAGVLVTHVEQGIIEASRSYSFGRGNRTRDAYTVSQNVA